MMALAGVPARPTLPCSWTAVPTLPAPRCRRNSARCETRRRRASSGIGVAQRGAHLRLGEHFGQGTGSAREDHHHPAAALRRCKFPRIDCRKKALFRDSENSRGSSRAAVDDKRDLLKATARAGRERHPQDPALGLRREGPIPHSRRGGRRCCLGPHGWRRPDLRTIPKVFARSIHYRRALGRLARSCTTLCRRTLTRGAFCAMAWRPTSMERSRESSAADYLKRIMEALFDYASVLARHRVLRGQGTPGRQRDGAASAQLGTLDHRRLHHRPVEGLLRAICNLPLEGVPCAGNMPPWLIFWARCPTHHSY